MDGNNDDVGCDSDTDNDTKMTVMMGLGLEGAWIVHNIQWMACSMLISYRQYRVFYYHIGCNS